MTLNRPVCFGSAVLIALLILAPHTASAQAIAGSVADDTGGVLPGVTVEASSPALIEGVRTAFTDGEGLYNIINLVPGTYSVTFTLPGFSTIVREGVVLTAGFTATIDAGMQVGGIEETITVTGASPLVDVQTTVAQSSVTTELLKSLPTGGGFTAQSLITLVPGVTGTADVGGSSGIYRSNGQSGGMFFHGKSDVIVLYDGMGTSSPNGVSIPYVLNSEFASETVMETGGGNSESNATMVMNMIPREGANNFSFRTAGTYTNDSLQADNLTQEIRDQGIEFTNDVLKFYNYDITVGGPIKQDKVWFFAAGRAARNKNLVPGVFFNNGIGTPHYVPDESRKGFRTEWMRSGGGRVTWQASPKNKISGFADFQSFFNRGRGEFASPEAYQSQYNLSPEQLYQANWTSPVSNRFLVEGGVSIMRGRWPFPSPGDPDFAPSMPGVVSTVELSNNFRYGARSGYSDQTDQYRYTERGAASYVTGSHAFKVGFQLEQGVANRDDHRHGEVNYDFRDGVPQRITQYATYAAPSLKSERTTDLGLYIQDQWTLPRLSINAGVRFDYWNGRVPAQSLAATPFIPARDFAAIDDAISFTDLQPRLGVSYDVAGNGRTALKFAVGRYVETTLAGLVSRLNPISTSVNSARRTWNDTNLNFVPDCDLANFGENGECGPISDNNFGQNNPDATQYSDDVLRGFGNRNYTWDISAEVVQELMPGVSLTAGYYRNTAGNWRVNDNIEVTPADYDPFCATAPMDPRLPDGGGYEVCGLYDINPSAFGKSQTLVQAAEPFIAGNSDVTCGEQRTRGRAPNAGKNCGTSDFFGVSIDTRFNNGASLGGGFDTGRTRINSCFVIDSPQALLNCDTTIPFKAHHNAKIFGSFPFPGDISVSGTFQSVAGATYNADYRVPNDLISESLGRNLAACGTQTVCTTTTAVPLIAPYSAFLDRKNQLDLRVSKAITVGGVEFRGNLDLYNVTNGAPVLGANSRFGSSWLKPAGQQTLADVDAILPGRLLHFSGSLTF